MSKNKPQKEKINLIKILKLFWFAFYISAVSFGGGFVSISLTRETFVKKLKWVSEDEIFDINSIAQASPGAIAINTTMLTGYKVGGFLGAVATVLGSIIPPMVIITVFYFFYDAIKEFTFVAFCMKAMQAGVWAVVLSLIVDSWKAVLKSKSTFSILMLVLSFAVNSVCLFFFSISVVIYTIILSGVIGVTVSLLFNKNKKGED